MQCGHHFEKCDEGSVALSTKKQTLQDFVSSHDNLSGGDVDQTLRDNLSPSDWQTCFKHLLLAKSGLVLCIFVTNPRTTLTRPGRYSFSDFSTSV